MNINLTLLIQVVHFFIGYLIIDRLVLRFAVHHIEKEKSNKVQSEAFIMQTQGMVHNLQSRKIELWQQAQVQFNKLIPAGPEELPISHEQLVYKSFIDSAEVAQEASRVETYIIKKVVHDLK